MQVLAVEFLIKPEWVDAFAQAIADNALGSRNLEPGCRQFDVCRDPAEPARFFLYELYDDEASVQAHLRSAHFQRMNAATASWVERKTVWRYLRTSP